MNLGEGDTLLAIARNADEPEEGAAGAAGFRWSEGVLVEHSPRARRRQAAVFARPRPPTSGRGRRGRPRSRGSPSDRRRSRLRARRETARAPPRRPRPVSPARCAGPADWAGTKPAAGAKPNGCCRVHPSGARTVRSRIPSRYRRRRGSGDSSRRRRRGSQRIRAAGSPRQAAGQGSTGAARRHGHAAPKTAAG